MRATMLLAVLAMMVAGCDKPKAEQSEALRDSVAPEPVYAYDAPDTVVSSQPAAATIYDGKCVTPSGQVLWAGKARDFVAGADALDFTDAITGRRVQLTGALLCSWEWTETR